MSKKYLKFPDASTTDLEELKSFFDWQTEKIDCLNGDELLSRNLRL